MYLRSPSSLVCILFTLLLPSLPVVLKPCEPQSGIHGLHVRGRRHGVYGVPECQASAPTVQTEETALKTLWLQSLYSVLSILLSMWHKLILPSSHNSITCYKLSVSECYVLADACQSSRKGINRKVNGTMTLQRQIMGVFAVYLLFGTVALVVLLLLQTATDSSLRQRRRKSVRTTAASGLTKFVCCWKFVFTA